MSGSSVAIHSDELPKAKKSQSLWSDAWRRLKKNKGAVISFYAIVFICAAGFLAPWITPYSFETQDMNRVLVSPDSTNWLGTDSLGRDLFSRIVYGGRVSMTIGLLTAFISLFIGTLYGALAGWYGGRVDGALMRVIDILYSIPELVMLILIKIAFDSTNWFTDPEIRAVIGMLAALSLTGWASVARIVRAQVLQNKQMLFVEAATALGASSGSIVFKHILPNILGPIIVTLTFQVPANVLYESFLSFIGLGLQPPFSSWGVLASEGWQYLRTYPHLMIYPGIALFVSMLAFNLFGDGLRDAFDPKMKNR